MSDTADADGVLHSAGEGVGGFIAGIPAALGDFFSGVGEGAGVDGVPKFFGCKYATRLLTAVAQIPMMRRLQWADRSLGLQHAMYMQGKTTPNPPYFSNANV